MRPLEPAYGTTCWLTVWWSVVYDIGCDSVGVGAKKQTNAALCTEHWRKQFLHIWSSQVCRIQKCLHDRAHLYRCVYNLASTSSSQVRGIASAVHEETYLIPPRLDIILDIRPNHILGRRLFPPSHPGPFMQQAPHRLAVREKRHAALDRLYGVGVHTSLPGPGQEEGRLAGLELIVEVDEEGEE